MFQMKKKTFTEYFHAFSSGTLIALEQVPDPVFSEKMMGDGFAIDLNSSTISAPMDGEITLVFPTGHAYGIVTKEGYEILIHIGIDTVELQGKGFNNQVEVGQKVKAGDILTTLDLDVIHAANKSLITPCIFTSGEKIKILKENEMVERGTTEIIDLI